MWRFDCKKLHIRGNFEDNDLFFSVKIHTKTKKKTSVKPPLQPKTANFHQNLTFSCHHRRIFDNHLLLKRKNCGKTLRNECAYTKIWRNGGDTAITVENRHMSQIFLSFLAELDNSESFEESVKYKK